MKIEGYVTAKPELTHTRRPPDCLPPGGDFNQADDYFDAMRGKRLPVLDVAIDGSGYMIWAKGKRSGDFLWELDARDVEGPMEPPPQPITMEAIMRMFSKLYCPPMAGDRGREEKS